MAETRLKIKVGDHEFEAEGPVETVQAQFDAFTELISRLPTRVEKPPSEITESGQINSGQVNNSVSSSSDSGSLNLDKIMRSSGRVVSLTARASSTADAALLLLLGQRHFRNNDGVTGGEILDGLRESGQPTERADRVLDPLANEGSVITVGVGRGRRYRLSNTGLTRAQEVARALISTLP